MIAALKKRLGNKITETHVIARLDGKDILEIAMECAGLTRTASGAVGGEHRRRDRGADPLLRHRERRGHRDSQLPDVDGGLRALRRRRGEADGDGPRAGRDFRQDRKGGDRTLRTPASPRRPHPGGGQSFFHQADHRGSVTQITDAAAGTPGGLAESPRAVSPPGFEIRLEKKNKTGRHSGPELARSWTGVGQSNSAVRLVPDPSLTSRALSH